VRRCAWRAAVWPPWTRVAATVLVAVGKAGRGVPNPACAHWHHREGHSSASA
jgi:hypothetical protein